MRVADLFIVAGLSVAIFVPVAIAGCTTPGQLSPGAKTVVRTVDDVAKQLCLVAQSEALGKPVEALAADVCSAARDVEPFVPLIMEAKHEGARKLGLKLPREKVAGDGGSP